MSLYVLLAKQSKRLDLFSYPVLFRAGEVALNFSQINLEIWSYGIIILPVLYKSDNI